MRVVGIITAGLLLASAPVWAQNAPTLSSGEKETQAESAIGVMRSILTSVEKVLEEARDERDALRLNCVNKHKANVSGLLKVAELSLNELRAAVRERQPEAVDHEYRKIMVAKDKVDGYKTDADQCVGLLAFIDSEETERWFFDQNEDSKGVGPTTPAAIQPTPFRPPPASPTGS